MVAMSEGGNVTPLVTGRSMTTGRSLAPSRKRR
jgi:hypothetical protein